MMDADNPKVTSEGAIIETTSKIVTKPTITKMS
jgi:hypothetical protein